LFCRSISPLHVLSANQPKTNARAIWLCFGAFFDASALTASSLPSDSLATDHWPPFFPHSPLPPRRPPGPAGSGPAQTLPRWLLPDTDRPIVKDRTGPDLDERPLYFSMSPNQAIPADKSIRFPPLVAAQPLTILLGQEALNASGSMRAWLMAISHNARPLLVSFVALVVSKPKRAKGATHFLERKGPPTFWHQGNVGGPFRRGICHPPPPSGIGHLPFLLPHSPFRIPHSAFSSGRGHPLSGTRETPGAPFASRCVVLSQLSFITLRGIIRSLQPGTRLGNCSIWKSGRRST